MRQVRDAPHPLARGPRHPRVGWTRPRASRRNRRAGRHARRPPLRTRTRRRSPVRPARPLPGRGPRRTRQRNARHRRLRHARQDHDIDLHDEAFARPWRDALLVHRRRNRVHARRGSFRRTIRRTPGRGSGRVRRHARAVPSACARAQCRRLRPSRALRLPRGLLRLLPHGDSQHVGDGHRLRRTPQGARACAGGQGACGPAADVRLRGGRRRERHAVAPSGGPGARSAQRAQRPCRNRRRPLPRPCPRGHRIRPSRCPLRASRPPLRKGGGRRQRPGLHRLRAPSRRTEMRRRHGATASSGAPARPLPAAPLFAHEGPAGRIPARLRPGGRGGADSRLRRVRGADSGRRHRGPLRGLPEARRRAAPAARPFARGGLAACLPDPAARRPCPPRGRRRHRQPPAARPRGLRKARRPRVARADLLAPRRLLVLPRRRRDLRPDRGTAVRARAGRRAPRRRTGVQQLVFRLRGRREHRPSRAPRRRHGSRRASRTRLHGGHSGLGRRLGEDECRRLRPFRFGRN